MNIRPRDHRLAYIIARLWIAILSIVAIWIVLKYASQADAQEPPALEQRAATILREHCYKCHGTTRDDWNASDLTSARDMAEGILEMIATDEMPPKNLPKLSAAEKKTLRDWLTDKPLPPPDVPPLDPASKKPSLPPRLGDNWVRRQIDRDNGQDDSLYLSLALYHNLGATKQQIWDLQGAVSKAANMLSTARQIVVPKKVDPSGLVLRIDTSFLGWNDSDAADLFEAYPYAELSSGFIRADWFSTRAIRAPLYYRLLGVPATLREADATFGIDRQRFIDANLIRRAGITNSRVAFHNRAIEWSPANTGAVRLTYDTENEERERNIVNNPFGPANRGRFGNRAFDHDATEYIADLPNGLHLYAAFDGQGRRQDKVPENIASDPSQFSGNTSIIPGISCVSCHKTGIQSPVSDVVRGGAPLFGIGELAKAQALYAPKEEFARILARDESRYMAAVKQAIGPFKASDEPIGPTALEYDKPLDLKRAALESNTDEATLRNVIQSDADLQALGLGPLTQNQTITRDTWENTGAGTSPAQRVAQLIGR